MWEAPWTFQNKRLPSDGIGTLPLNLQNKSFLKDTVTDATFTYVWFHFWFQVPLFCSAESESEENLKALSYLCFIFVRLMYSEHWFFQKAQTCISAGMDWTAHLYGSSFRTNDIVRFLIYLLEPRGEQTAATVNPQLVLILKPSNCSTFTWKHFERRRLSFWSQVSASAQVLTSKPGIICAYFGTAMSLLRRFSFSRHCCGNNHPRFIVIGAMWQLLFQQLRGTPFDQNTWK